MSEALPEKERVDKWLWAARFFKTRSLASDAVDGGKVHVNGNRVKPAKEVRVGDAVSIAIGELRWQVTVLALSQRRGPATQARLLYEEAPESLAARLRQIEQRRLAGAPAHGYHGRPTKRQRREIDKLRRNREQDGG